MTNKKNAYIILFLTIIIFSPLIPMSSTIDDDIKFVEATPTHWWNNDWLYRREIRITNNQAEDLFNFQILLELTADDYIGRTQSDGSDIRFVIDDLTACDFWIERWDELGTTNKIWVEIPELLGSSNTFINIYYGNPNAMSESDGIATFIAWDDFNDYLLNEEPRSSRGWESVGSYALPHAIVDIERGGMKMYLDNPGGVRTIFANRWTDVGTVTICFDWNAEIGSGYFLAYDDGNVLPYTWFYSNQLQYYDPPYKSYNAPLYHSYNTWHKMKYNIWNNDHSVAIDDETHNTDGSGNYHTFIDGADYFSFYTYTTGSYHKYYIDNFYVRKYSSEDPSIYIYDEEILETPIEILSIELLCYNSTSGNYEINKGEKIPIKIYIKNNGLSTIHIKSISWQCESVHAGSGSDFTIAYRNAAGPIILEGTQNIIADLSPGETRYLYSFINFQGYPNGAMNLGEWILNKISVSASNAPTAHYIPIINTYYVIPKAKMDGPHAVFLYYLWNSAGPGETFGTENPRDYFEEGYGNRKAGFFAFRDPTNVPVTFDFIICWDENSWEIEDGLIDETEINLRGRNYASSLLNILGTSGWRDSSYTNPFNCGFDFLIMGAARSHDTMGVSIANSYTFFKAGRSTHPLYWKENIDGCVEHQLSHLFGCRSGESHDSECCVNAFDIRLQWPPIWDYLHEYLYFLGLHLYNPVSTHILCDSCDWWINSNWDRFYKITT